MTSVISIGDKIELTKNLSEEDLSILKVRYIYSIIDGFNLPEVISESKDEDLKKGA